MSITFFLSYTQVLHLKKTGLIADTPIVDDVVVLSTTRGFVRKEKHLHLMVWKIFDLDERFIKYVHIFVSVCPWFFLNFQYFVQIKRIPQSGKWPSFGIKDVF